jgi:hypothetical protein
VLQSEGNATAQSVASQTLRFSVSDTQNSGRFGQVFLLRRSAWARSAGLDRALVWPQRGAESFRRCRATRPKCWAFECICRLTICRLTILAFPVFFCSGKPSSRMLQTTQFLSKRGACFRRRKVQAGSGRSPERFLGPRFGFGGCWTLEGENSCSVWSRAHVCRKKSMALCRACKHV